MAPDDSPPEPFWEASYRDAVADVWGPPSKELIALLPRLPRSAPVLDAGCGDGRNALFLAGQGFSRVRAFDTSAAAIDKLSQQVAVHRFVIDAWVGALRDFAFDRDYGLVVAEGLLQFVEADVGDRFLASARQHTLPGGAHLISVFTDVIEPPRDLAPFIRRLYRDGELRDYYADWLIEHFDSRVFEDEHDGGLRHRHATNDLLAIKPR